MTFRCLSPYCKPSMIVMSQREDVHLYCPVFTSLLKLILLSRKDYCPALYTLANSDITSGRMYCPALYILTNSDITERILHCQGLMEVCLYVVLPWSWYICYIIFLMLVIMCRIQAFITWVFLAPSLILFIVIYKIYVIKLYFNSKNLCALLLSTFCFQRNSQKMHWKKAVKLFLIFLILTLDCLFPILQFTQNIKLHTI